MGEKMVNEKEGGYQPSEDDLRLAKEHMTEKEMAMSEAREEMFEHKDEEAFLKSRVYLDPEITATSGFYDTFIQRNYDAISQALRERYGDDYYKGEKILNIRLLWRGPEQVRQGTISADITRKGRRTGRDGSVWTEGILIKGVN
jgi:hypothetical protein